MPIPKDSWVLESMVCRLPQVSAEPFSIVTASRDAFVEQVTLQGVETIGNSKVVNTELQVAKHWLLSKHADIKCYGGSSGVDAGDAKTIRLRRCFGLIGESESRLRRRYKIGQISLQ